MTLSSAVRCFSSPFLRREVASGIIDCSERALDTGLHVHQYDAFDNLPQMKKVICLDNDLRHRYTTRGLFEELLGGYNTLYFINWRGVRLASHRVRLPDTDDKNPWGRFSPATPLLFQLRVTDNCTIVTKHIHVKCPFVFSSSGFFPAARECIFGGHHVFSRNLNNLVDSYVANEMAVQTGGDFMLVHLRLEKVQVHIHCNWQCTAETFFFRPRLLVHWAMRAQRVLSCQYLKRLPLE